MPGGFDGVGAGEGEVGPAGVPGTCGGEDGVGIGFMAVQVLLDSQGCITEAEMEVDVNVEDHGSIYLFHLNTEAARTWVNEHVSEERTYFGAALAVEARYAPDLAQGMVDDDLVVE